MKAVLLLAVLTAAAASCHNPSPWQAPEEPTTGGPCNYSYDTLAITVLQVVRQPGNNGYEILFRNPQGSDSLLYSHTGHGYASRQDIATYDIRPGTQCTVFIQTAHGGACPSSVTTSLMHFAGINVAH